VRAGERDTREGELECDRHAERRAEPERAVARVCGIARGPVPSPADQHGHRRSAQQEGEHDQREHRELERGPQLPLAEPHPSGQRFAVTDRLSAAGQPASREVTREYIPPGAVAWVRHDLPLNGEWSDLTATFRVERGVAGLDLILMDIHVF
jgi:hypothetical protein